MTRRWDVLGIGENSVDIVHRAGARTVSPGGQVATTMATCAALGLQAGYLGTFGDDEHAATIRQELSARGVDLSPSLTRRAPNRTAVILVDDRGDRTVFWQRDPALRLEPGQLFEDVVTGARLLHVDNTDEEAAIVAARMARQAGLHVTTDVDRVTPRTSQLIAAATIPILAEHVPQALTGETDPERALRAMTRRPVEGRPTPEWICVTLGAKGALLLDGDSLHHEPALQVDVVDTTGAGDVFRGAFIAALLRGDEPDAILRFASAAAAVSCTREGALGGVPSRADVDYFLRRMNPSGGTTSEME